MKAEEIVTRLALTLPQLTDKFTNEVSVNSMTRAGSVVTVACNQPHGLQADDQVSITGAITLIDISSLTRSGTVGTLVTSTDHDLTNPIATTITISGAAEPEFNGTFTRINVDNRTTIRFTMVDSGPTTATGDPQLQNAESALRDYNTIYSVLDTPSKSTFTVAESNTTLADPIGTIVARTKPRVSAAAEPARVLDAYTKKEIDELWMFVVLEDVVASKSRAIGSDAIDNLQRGNEFRQQIIQPFTLYVFIPASASIAAREARDVAEDIFRPICQSILFTKFDSGLFVGATQGPVQFVSHGVFDYNTAVYVHAYSFQQVVDINFEDTVGADLDVAFRDISLSLTPDLPATQGAPTAMTASIDLDDV